jgi:tetratricopeptide (TPR) repeat protein
MDIQQTATDDLARARLAIKECRWIDAVADLKTAYSRMPEDPEVAWRLGFALSRDGQYNEAIRVLTEVHGKQPKDARWPYMIGYQHYQQGSWTEAIDWFSKALVMRPAYLKALYRRGYAHTAVGQESQATSDLSACIGYWEEATPDEQELDRPIYGKAQFQLGKIYLKKGLSLKARRHLQIAAQVCPNDHDTLYELGQCYLKNNQLDDALQTLQAADRIKPGTDYIIDRLAQTLIRKGDYPAAESVYNRIPKHRRRPFVLQHLGSMYLEQGQHERALPYLEAAARRQPDNHNIQYALGSAQEGVGQMRRAHASYTLASGLRKTKYNLDFREAQEAAKRTSEALAALPSSNGEPDASKAGEGIVQSYNESRGYGFIVSKSHGRVFFHVSSLAGRERPRQGSRVTFSCEPSPKGLRATSVELA